MTTLSQRLLNSWQVWRAVGAGRAFARASREEMDAHVSRRLSALVQFAAERVPHYRELFEREGIDPREIRTPQDLQRLPILEKQTLATEPLRLMPEGATADRCYALATGGTTGRATPVWYSLPAIWEGVGRAQRQRDIQTRLVDPALARGPKLTIGRPGGTQSKRFQLYREELLLPSREATLQRVSLADPPADIIARIHELRPRIIGTNGSLLEILALYLREYDPEAELPYLFTYSAEPLSPWAREALEQRHGAKVLSTYTAGEMSLIAYECEHRRLLHRAEDIALVRVCDEQGQELREGIGEVIATNLLNRQTVLINYRLGDRVEVTAERCPCGTTLQSFRRVEGRTVNLIVRPDGRLVSSLAVSGVLARASGIVRAQFVQEEVGRARVRLVLGPHAERARVQATLGEQLRPYLGPEMQLEYELVEDIPTPPGGKFESVISRVPVPDARQQV
jgi:phenylacetate-CoA ligase